MRRATGSYKMGGVAGIAFLLLYVLLIGFSKKRVKREFKEIIKQDWKDGQIDAYARRQPL